MLDPSIRAVFFDVVGTLLFPTPAVSRTYAEFANRHGANLTEADVRGPLREAFLRQERIDHAAGWRTDEARERERWRTIVREVLPGADHEACFAELWNWFEDPRAWTLTGELAELSDLMVGRGLTVGLASNFDARLLSLVTAFPELRPLADHCVISSQVGWRKPAREFFAEVARVAGQPPEAILYVGDDRRNDYEGAVAVGMKAVLFDPEGEHRDVPTVRALRQIVLPPTSCRSIP